MSTVNQSVTDGNNVSRNLDVDYHVPSAVEAIKAGLSRKEFMGCEEGDYRWTLFDAYRKAYALINAIQS